VIAHKDSELTKEILEKGAMEHNKLILQQAPTIVYFVIPKHGTKPEVTNRFVRDGIKYAAFQRSKPVAEVTEEDIDKVAEGVMGA